MVYLNLPPTIKLLRSTTNPCDYWEKNGWKRGSHFKAYFILDISIYTCTHTYKMSFGSHLNNSVQGSSKVTFILYTAKLCKLSKKKFKGIFSFGQISKGHENTSQTPSFFFSRTNPVWDCKWHKKCCNKARSQIKQTLYTFHLNQGHVA